MTTLSLPGTASPTSLILPANLEFEEWQEIGQKICECNQSVKWWIGDWINYGEAAFGEKYSQALSVTKLEYATLANISYTCRRVGVNERRPGLPFAHHFETAQLEPSVRAEILDDAEANELTSKEVRERVKEKRNPDGETEDTHLYLVSMKQWTEYGISIEAKNEEEAKKIGYKNFKKELMPEWFNVEVSLVEE